MNARATLHTGERSRLRLVVLQALVLSLFATLLVRLWYLQVASGDEYRAKAASQSIREVVVQPDRGLILDAMGRPLVANRSAWVVSLDRGVLRKLDEEKQETLLGLVANALDKPVEGIRAKLVDCGTEGAVVGQCWNGSPYQPVPLDADVPQDVALLIREQNEDYPGVLVREQSVRSYPSPYGVNAAHVLGYLSPITEGELDAAEAADDASVNGASQVGRAGVEKAYDEYLRGMPGYQNVGVDSRGNTIGDEGVVEAVPGDTLVTSIDARIQAVVEKQLHDSIMLQRSTMDTVTGRKYAANSGAAVVMETRTGRIVAMSSQPTYDPGVWVGGISQKQLTRLYSEKAGTPLLSRATQGQFAPGSTWKPFMTAAALTHGYGLDTILNCSSSFAVGNRAFKNYESGAYGPISFAKALEVSCNTFFYRIGYEYWRKYGSDVANVDAKDPLVEQAKLFGFGSETGLDIPGEASGRIADRQWKLDYYESMKDYYCGLEKDPPKDISAFLKLFSHEFCVEGYAYRAGDAANFAIGQGDTVVTPLQLARGYAAIANGGTLWEPTIGKAVIDPEGKLVKEIEPRAQGHVDLPKKVFRYIDEALYGVAKVGTMAWRLGNFPLDKVQVHAKTGSAEVYGKQSTGWVASYTKDYVVVMMIEQGGTGSGSVGPAVRRVWETLYGVTPDQLTIRRDRTAIPGVVQTDELPVFAPDGAILPPRRKEDDQ